MKKKIISFSLAFCLMFSTAFAHSGRTDSNGGHKDNNNVSGLGYYHYHCGGNPAHLHFNGVCPYKTSYTSSTQAYNYVSSVAPTTTPQPVVTVSEPNTFEVIKTTYPVKINSQDISNFASGWPPFIYEDITYIPLTSYLVNELNLKLDFNNETGLNLSNQNSISSNESNLTYKELFLVSSLLHNMDKSLTTASIYFRNCYQDYCLSYINKEVKKGFQNSKEILDMAVNSVNSYYANRELITEICIENNLATRDELNKLFDDIKYYPLFLQECTNVMNLQVANNLSFENYSEQLSLCDTGHVDITNSLNKIQSNISNKILNLN